MATGGSIAAPARVVLPAAVVHVKEQRDNVNDVHMEKHHHHHEVRAGAHAALVAGEALARRPERQGRAPGQSRVLSLWGVLVVSHIGEIRGVGSSSTAEFIGFNQTTRFGGCSESGRCKETLMHGLIKRGKSLKALGPISSPCRN